MSRSVQRVFNFSPGPAVLPLAVLEQAQRELVCLPGSGASVLEISHRGAAFMDILQQTKARLKSLLSIPDEYHILLLQGGARLQFSMIPMNLLRGADVPAEYILTGSWGKKALAEAQKEGPIRVIWDGKAAGYDRVPHRDELNVALDAPYVYMVSNETIEGVQFSDEPHSGKTPLVCDASSDFLHRPLDVRRYGLLYACAQKNAGPAGVTIVILHDDLLARSRQDLPGYLNYREHVANDSLYNTPPTFGIYIVNLVAQWLQEEIGGLEAMHELNRRKAQLIYDVIDSSGGFYRGHADRNCRSLMNVTFRLPDDHREKEFLRQAAEHGLESLKGHRSVGGIRASIYNAMPLAGVEALRDFMQDFLDKSG